MALTSPAHFSTSLVQLHSPLKGGSCRTPVLDGLPERPYSKEEAAQAVDKAGEFKLKLRVQTSSDSRDGEMVQPTLSTPLSSFPVRSILYGRMTELISGVTSMEFWL